MPEELKPEEIEKINKKYGDIIGMVMDYKNLRISASNLMDKISERCDAFYEAGMKARFSKFPVDKEMVKKIIDIFIKYKKELQENKIDYREFAAHDILSILAPYYRAKEDKAVKEAKEANHG
jgi:hypothetical protein